MAAHQFNAAVPTPTTCLPSPFSLHFIFHAELLFWRSLVVARREGKVFVTGVDGHFNPIAELLSHRREQRREHHIFYVNRSMRDDNLVDQDFSLHIFII